MQLTLYAARTVQSSGLGGARPLTICTRGVLDASRLSPSLITVLHSWRALSPVGARRLEAAVRHHAGPASASAPATRAMHPPATPQPRHVAPRDRPPPP